MADTATPAGKAGAATAGDAASPRRKRRSSEEVADRILDAALEEFGSAGYSGATTAAIARRAEVTEAQIFRLYESKQELFRAAIFKPLNAHFWEFQSRHDMTGADAGSMRAAARRYISELQEFMIQHWRMLMSLIVASAYSPETTGNVGELEGLRAYFEGGAKTMAERTGRKGKVSPELMVRVSFAAVLANVMFRDWLFPPGLASEHDIHEAIIDFVIDGLGAAQEERGVTQ